MAKKVLTHVRLQIPAGKANPSPPVGPALGQHQVNIMEFCKQYNEKTKNQPDGMVLPVVVTIYSDKSFSFVIKTPLTSVLLRKAAKLEKGSNTPGRSIVGKVTRSQIENIAKIKLPDLNTSDIKQAIKIVEGTAKSMGLEIED